MRPSCGRDTRIRLYDASIVLSAFNITVKRLKILAGIVKIALPCITHGKTPVKLFLFITEKDILLGFFKLADRVLELTAVIQIHRLFICRFGILIIF